jgi:hypothetical protein
VRAIDDGASVMRVAWTAWWWNVVILASPPLADGVVSEKGGYVET